MQIAITGPTGAIGLDLVNQCLDRGDKVIALVNPNSKRLNKLPKTDDLKIVKCNITDYKKIESEYKCDIFYHLAWVNTFGPARDDVFSQSNNIQYALDAVNLASSWGAKSFVGVGSQAEYGIANVPLNKDTPVNPESGYGIAKYAAGKLCELLCHQKKMKFNWARILSVYGPNDAEHTLIMYLIRSLQNNTIPELTECEQIWDYIYSKDCAKALLSIGHNGVDGRVYCIGSGERKTLKEYVKTLRDVVAPNNKLGFGMKSYYPHQPMFLTADISDLINDTNYSPNYSFEEGIKEIIKELNRSR